MGTGGARAGRVSIDWPWALIAADRTQASLYSTGDPGGGWLGPTNFQGHRERRSSCDLLESCQAANFSPVCLPLPLPPRQRQARRGH